MSYFKDVYPHERIRKTVPYALAIKSDKSQVPKNPKTMPQLAGEDEILFNEETILTSSSPRVYQTVGHENIDESAVDDDPAKKLAEEDEDYRLLNLFLHWTKRPTVAMAALPLLFFLLGDSATSASTTIILNKLACNSIAKDGVCDPVASQILVANFLLYLTPIVTICSLPAAALTGELSDKHGRKLFMICIIVFAFVGKLLIYLTYTWSNSLHFFALLAFNALAVCLGSTYTMVALTNSYISDVVHPDQRRYSLGLGMAALSVGSAVGPLLGNLINSIASRGIPDSDGIQISKITTMQDLNKADFAPLKMELGLLVLLFIVYAFIVPESRSKKSRERSLSVISPAQAGPQLPWYSPKRIVELFRPLKLLGYPEEVVPDRFKSNIVRYRFIAIGLITAMCLFNSTANGIGMLYFQYGIYKFDWDTQTIGASYASLSITRTFILVVVAPLIAKFLTDIVGFRPDLTRPDKVDLSMITLGYTLDIFSSLMVTLSTTSTQLLIGVATATLGSFASPASNATILKLYPSSRTGEYFGATGLLSNVILVITPIITVNIYNYGLAHDFASLPFLVLTVVLVFNLMIMGAIRMLMR